MGSGLNLQSFLCAAPEEKHTDWVSFPRTSIPRNSLGEASWLSGQYLSEQLALSDCTHVSSSWDSSDTSSEFSKAQARKECFSYSVAISYTFVSGLKGGKKSPG